MLKMQPLGNGKHLYFYKCQVYRKQQVLKQVNLLTYSMFLKIQILAKWSSTLNLAITF